ncbi:PD-(D/E)XK nuclease family protein [Abyssicoccus albus]|uniref:PD-(D/E)XK nuclease superfamily protein n=1 Tax=Abyssicoccus albus TaxID=1817405 RepID=A0A3N5BBM8_9BACL|nr:PD-(D/E)XK nuclease family protein [Abyssicoccus albus]RPF55176.1 PD-(D/E)XK nuclease superfamily protein [Abyssicoccus albus]
MIKLVDAVNTNHLFERIIEEDSKSGKLFGSPIYVLTRADNVLKYQHTMTNTVQNNGSFNIAVFTYTRLMWHIYNEIGFGKKIQASKDAHALLIYRIMNDYQHEEEMSVFKAQLNDNDDVSKQNSIEHIEFAYAILNAIQEFEDYLVDVNMDEIVNLNEMPKLKAISFIYDKYKEEIKRLSTSPNKDISLSSINMLKDFIERLKSYNNSEEIRALQHAKIYIHGITDFTPIEIKLIQELSRLGLHIEISTTDDSLHQETFERREDGILKPIEMKSSLHKQENLVNKLQIFETPNHRVEFELIAKRIENLVHTSSDTNFKDFVVYYRDDMVLQQLLRTFNRYNINVQYNENKPMTTHPFTQFVDGLFEYANINYDNLHHPKYLETIIKIAKTRYLTSSVLNTYLDRIDDFVHSYAVTYGELFNEDHEFDPEVLFYKKYKERTNENDEFLKDIALKRYEKELAKDEVNTTEVEKENINKPESKAYKALVERQKEYYESLNQNTDEGNVDLEDALNDKEIKDIGQLNAKDDDEEAIEESVELNQSNKVDSDYTESFVNTVIVLRHIIDGVNNFKAIFEEEINEDSNRNVGGEIKKEIPLIDVLDDINQYFNHYGIYTKLSGQYSYYEDEEKHEVQQVYNTVVNIIESGYISLNGIILDNRSKSLKLMTDLFRTTFSKSVFQQQQLLKDAVYIKSLDDVSFDSYKYVFIANFDRNNTPRTIKDNKLISDRIKEKFKNRLSPTTIELRDKDKSLFYRAIQSAEEKVVITYSLINHDGRVTKESPFIGELINDSKLNINKYTNRYRVYRNSLLGEWIEYKKNKDNEYDEIIHFDEYINLLTSKDHIKTPLIHRLNELSKIQTNESKVIRHHEDQQAQNKSKTEVLKPWVHALNYIKDNNKDLYDEINDYYNFYSKVSNQFIGPSLAHELYLSESERDQASNEYIFEPSVSRFQTYNGCAFKHFAQYGLHLQTREAFDIESKDTGTVQHEVLERLFKDSDIIETLRHEEDDEKIVANQELSDRIHEIIEDVLSDSAYVNGKYNHSHYNQYLKRKIHRSVRNAAIFSIMSLSIGKYNPERFEADFGFVREDDKSNKKSKVANVKEITTAKVDNKSYKVHIKGQIDRVDIYRDEENKKAYINVIDYKLSKKDLLLEDVLDGGQLQQFSYMYVIKENKEQFGLEGYEVLPNTMMFLPVHSKNGKVEYDTDKKKVKEILDNRNDENEYESKFKTFIFDKTKKDYKPKGMFINEAEAFNKEVHFSQSEGLMALLQKYNSDENSIDKESYRKIFSHFYPSEYGGPEPEKDYKKRNPEKEMDELFLIRNQSQHKFISHDGFEEVISKVKDIYEKNTSEIFNGHALVSPKENDDGELQPCEYCEFKSACYFDITNSESRKPDKEEYERIILEDILKGVKPGEY